MLSWVVTRTRLGRATTPHLRPQIKQKKHNYSTKGPGRSTTPKIFSRNIAFTSAVTAPGLWWLMTVLEDDDQVPRFENLGYDLSAAPGPSKEQVTRILSKGAYSFRVGDVFGVSRYDGTQLTSNDPCEDRFVHGKLASPWDDNENQWIAWGVFDGHAGWQTAELLKNQLIPSVRQSLTQASSSTKENGVIQQAIMKAFVDLDNTIIKTAQDTAQNSTDTLAEKVTKLIPAFAGSCALVSIYDPGTSTLHVACTGDSRAVLAQKQTDGKWTATPLSKDQTGRNLEEITRLYHDHPGENNIVKDGRVLGMMVSRAFGDSRWKWPLDFQQDMKRRFHGPAVLTPRYDVRTPPYLTAEPVVTSTKIDPGKPSLLIMASDGLWDMLSSQQAVDLVGCWLGAEVRNSNSNTKGQSTDGPFDFGKLEKGTEWKFKKDRTTVQDENAAVHLVRNSLGGNHHELVAGRLAFDAPFSRGVRDDITVQVAFFNVDEKK